jgi:hypothetical protein
MTLNHRITAIIIIRDAKDEAHHLAEESEITIKGLSEDEDEYGSL